MSDKSTDKADESSSIPETGNAVDQAVSESSAYEIIRKRLDQQGSALESYTKNLNESRLEEFGSSDMSVLGRLRVRTENNCIARDIAQVGRYLNLWLQRFYRPKKRNSYRRCVHALQAG